MATTNLSVYDSDSIPNASTMRFGLVVSEWNPDITQNLHDGAVAALLEHGALVENITAIKVPGSFELIYGCKHLLNNNELDAVIAIGNVIRGETEHFTFVCEGVTQGIVELNLAYNTPTVFCVLTDNNKQQSLDRSGGKHGNKGVECAVAAIKMAALKQGL
ncbi:6,7-dimethyl-8-ribityllumazine synthase [Lutimonas halocynthiae]|uniref:6,7-dimethyl-8-ribityllumazine synthase n=1 Tax=Lutimonas halocynthiae TaxID=1446477 RepID=UPI0025B40300|nr:6,7-dimethyl-8-ribityllumazine synthase [Lutimonas halocynthiae]MDN3644262.1 6,7-dimethyl-8-ribityllumazine synthase [Lutimonas halocynthiae]